MLINGVTEPSKDQTLFIRPVLSLVISTLTRRLTYRLLLYIQLPFVPVPRAIFHGEPYRRDIDFLKQSQVRIPFCHSCVVALPEVTCLPSVPSISGTN